MKKINIDWLGACEKCGMESALVETETGYEDWLYEGDKVICNGCGHMGHVVILPCEPVAYAEWDALLEAK